eukprot:1144409-Pelagomonas_calceolata.AAC.16
MNVHVIPLSFLQFGPQISSPPGTTTSVQTGPYPYLPFCIPPRALFLPALLFPLHFLRRAVRRSY